MFRKKQLGLIVLMAIFAASVWASTQAVTINVDAAADQHAINPLIYGVNFGNTTSLNALNNTCNRYGGNRTSRYNWQQNVDQTGEFYYWESYPDANVPYGLADSLVSDSQASGAEPLITIPMLDYIAKTDVQRHILCSYPQDLYPNETDYSPECANPNLQPICCGTGINTMTEMPEVWSADQRNASTANSVAFQQSFVQHLKNEGSHSYILDNEHGIWHETHRDVQPNGITMDLIWGKMQDYSVMIKSEDPAAKILGPEEFGWTGYFFSGADIQECNVENCWANPPDRDAHGGEEYIPWVLDQFKNYDDMNNQRLLDVFTLHFYPQAEEFSSDVTNATKLLRNRSTRGLWDPAYVNESWIADAGPDNGIVQLIPRMKNWVAAHYPGTQIGITEYHWGPDNPDQGAAVLNDPNGATTQADVLGIFGREGLDVANLFTDGPVRTTSAIGNAFKMYRNYDGAKSTFGETSVRAISPDPDNVSSFASIRALDGALTIMVINKNLGPGSTSATINLANFQHNGTAQVYRYNSNNTISHLADMAIPANTITDSLPRQTITLYIVEASAAAPDFSVSCTPTTVLSAPGGSGTSNCTVVSIGGFASLLTLDCAGLPAGAACAFDNNPLIPTASSGLTVNVDAGVAEAVYPFTVSATDGVTTHTTNMNLTVSTGPPSLLFDEFDDNVQSWFVQKGTWTESGGNLVGAAAGKPSILFAPQPWSPSGQFNCSTCTLETDVALGGGLGSAKVFIQHWYQDKSHRVDLLLQEARDKITIKQKAGRVVAKTSVTYPLFADTNYHIKLSYDGAAFHLEIDGVPVITLPTSVAPSGNLSFKIKKATLTVQDVNIY